MTDRFDPEAVRCFRFLDYDFDAASLTARLRYGFDDGPRFIEEIAFEGGRVPATEAARAALDRALRHLHLVAGISYYKAAVPPEIVIESGPLPADTAAFLDRLYLLGLGEFAYKNGLDLSSRIAFPAAEGDGEPAPRLDLPRCTAVPVGGGKDSVVTIEALKAADEPMVLISVNDYAPIKEVSRVAGVPRIIVRRRISPALLELNARGALNGHVPITAILAAVLTAAAVLYGFDAVAMSNERSADEGNLTWNGLAINHQYSKSSAFERDFNAVVERHVLPGFLYFSFLRPFSELAVAAAFSRAPRAYRKVFRSCNTAFRLDELRRGRRWCRDCPKCRFVFLALAPFLAKQEMVGIFGGDMLDDPAQEKGFADMLGLGEHKPFECVGEVAECVAALVLLARSPEWREARLVREFAAAILPRLDDPDRVVVEALKPGSVASVPERYRSMLPETLTPNPSPRGRGEPVRLAEFAGKRVAVWGLGREGWSVLHALDAALPELPVTVLDDAPLSPESAASLAAAGHVETVTGPAAVAAALGGFDVVVKSPGISLYRPEVLEARRRGVHVTSATRIWFAEHPGASVVCVTGTKGKSTTASLVAHLLRAAGFRVELRGNIGRPLLAPVAETPDAWVVEVSSYQAADLEADPSVAVLLNLYPEHLDWHGDAETYYRDKLRLFAHQRDGVAVVNRADPVSTRFVGTFRHPVYFNDPQGLHVAGGCVRDGARELVAVDRIALPGAHNHANVCAALTAIRCLQPAIDLDGLAAAVASFRGLPHRLMPLGERDGVLWVDDSISTTPQSAMAAIAAFPGRPVTVLLGGYERRLPYDELARYVVARPVHAVVTLPPSGLRIAAAVRRELDGAEGPPVLIETGDLEQAVEAARRVTPAGGVVLLSPAAPSYGAFRNFEERGEAFARAAGLKSPANPLAD